MIYFLLIVLIIITVVILFIARGSKIDIKAQKLSDKKSKRVRSNAEAGRVYERYIGYLHELYEGHVEYHGAINGFQDLGRDLIIRNGDEVYVIQAKRWDKTKKKLIKEKHIFQLYGSMAHYKLTAIDKGLTVKAVFYTTGIYSKKAREVAQTLGVELKTQAYDPDYPKIKCCTLKSGQRVYFEDSSPYYDKVRMQIQNGDFYARTVKEATSKGYRKPINYRKAS